MAVSVEMWGRPVVLLNDTFRCTGHDCEIGRILSGVREANDGKLGGFPDVIGIFQNGTIALREAKNVISKDRLGVKQHEMANLLRHLYGDRLDLRVVEWRFA